MANARGKKPTGKPNGRPPGRQNDRTLLLRQGLDRAVPDAYFWRKVRERMDEGDTQMIVQVGKWKGLTERQEIDLHSMTGIVFRCADDDGNDSPPGGGA